VHRDQEQLEQRLTHYIDSRIEELDKRIQARNEAMEARYMAMLRMHQLRTYMLAAGLGGPVIGLLIAILARM